VCVYVSLNSVGCQSNHISQIQKINLEITQMFQAIAHLATNLVISSSLKSILYLNPSTSSLDMSWSSPIKASFFEFLNYCR